MRIKLEDLNKLSPENLIALSQADINIAWDILNNDILLMKFGYNVKDNSIAASSNYFKFFPGDKNKVEFSGYLCRFLILHKIIYDEAKKRPDVMERLSTYQKEALEDTFYRVSYRKRYAIA